MGEHLLLALSSPNLEEQKEDLKRLALVFKIMIAYFLSLPGGLLVYQLGYPQFIQWRKAVDAVGELKTLPLTPQEKQRVNIVLCYPIHIQDQAVALKADSFKMLYERSL